MNYSLQLYVLMCPHEAAIIIMYHNVSSYVCVCVLPLCIIKCHHVSSVITGSHHVVMCHDVSSVIISCHYPSSFVIIYHHLA